VGQGHGVVRFTLHARRFTHLRRGLQDDRAEVDGAPLATDGFDGQFAVARVGDADLAESDRLELTIVAGVGRLGGELLACHGDFELAAARRRGDLCDDVERAGLVDLELPAQPCAVVGPVADAGLAADVLDLGA